MPEIQPVEETPYDETEKRAAEFRRMVIADARKISFTRIVEIVSLAIALAALYVYSRQLDTMAGQLKEMQDSGAQTAQLIVNAAHQAADTHTLAEAANRQVKKLDASVRQASRLAKATEEANANVVNSDRPWMSVGLEVDGFETDQTPTAKISFINSGRRPAKVTLTQYRWAFYNRFPANPEYPRDDTPSSISIIPPNSQSTVTLTMDKLTLANMSLFKLRSAGAYYIHMNVEYDDPVTNSHHWTHGCWEYVHFETGIHSGFYNCREYNDTDQREKAN